MFCLSVSLQIHINTNKRNNYLSSLIPKTWDEFNLLYFLIYFSTENNDLFTLNEFNMHFSFKYHLKIWKASDITLKHISHTHILTKNLYRKMTSSKRILVVNIVMLYFSQLICWSYIFFLYISSYMSSILIFYLNSAIFCNAHLSIQLCHLPCLIYTFHFGVNIDIFN